MTSIDSAESEIPDTPEDHRREGIGSGYRVPEHIVRQIRRLAVSGFGVSAIARACGVSRDTVRKSLVIRGKDSGAESDSA